MGKKKKSCFSTFSRFFKRFDRFGHHVSLNFNREDTVSTSLGGFLSLGVIALLIYFGYDRFMVMVRRESSNISTTIIKQDLKELGE